MTPCQAIAPPDRAGGVTAGDRFVQVEPSQVQVSLKRVTKSVARPPKSTTCCRTGSNVIMPSCRAPGPPAALSSDQSVPLHAQVSDESVPSIRRPPNRIKRVPSQARFAPARAAGECTGLACVQLPAAPSQIQVSPYTLSELAPPNSTT